MFSNTATPVFSVSNQSYQPYKSTNDKHSNRKTLADDRSGYTEGANIVQQQPTLPRCPRLLHTVGRRLSNTTWELVKLFSTIGIPDVLHSDQGRSFASTIHRQTLDTFGVTKPCTSAYHPRGMVWLSASTDRYCICRQRIRLGALPPSGPVRIPDSSSLNHGCLLL